MPLLLLLRAPSVAAECGGDLAAASSAFCRGGPAGPAHGLARSRPLAVRPPRRHAPAHSVSAAAGGPRDGPPDEPYYSERPPSAYRGHTEVISSTANEYVKHALKLRSSGSYRQQQRACVAVGRRLLTELADDVARPGGASAIGAPFRLRARTVLLADGAELPPGVDAARVLRASGPVLKKIAGVENADSVDLVAELELPPAALLAGARPAGGAAVGGAAAGGPPPLRPRRVLALDGVQDPGNVGTLLRTALALGWDCVYFLPGCCDPFNEKALRASRGAAFRLPLAAGGWPELAAAAAAGGLACLAADPDPSPARGGVALADDAAAAGLRAGPLCLVLGAEGQGLSAAASTACRPLAIPIGRMESLNVAVAGGILMWALRGDGAGGGAGELEGARA